jgi:hypothetical protein
MHNKANSTATHTNSVGNPGELIDLLFTSYAGKKHAVEQIMHEGPEHKQVLSSLLLGRLYTMVTLLEKCTDTKFQLQTGNQLKIQTADGKVAFPLAVPIVVAQEKEVKKVAAVISLAPEHELLAYAMCLQVVGWAIKVLPKKVK